MVPALAAAGKAVISELALQKLGGDEPPANDADSGVAKAKSMMPDMSGGTLDVIAKLAGGLL